MKIEIDYNGALVSCKVNGKPFNKCDIKEQIFAMDSFRIILKNYKDRNEKKKSK